MATPILPLEVLITKREPLRALHAEIIAEARALGWDASLKLANFGRVEEKDLGYAKRLIEKSVQVDQLVRDLTKQIAAIYEAEGDARFEAKFGSRGVL